MNDYEFGKFLARQPPLSEVRKAILNSESCESMRGYIAAMRDMHFHPHCVIVWLAKLQEQGR